jgi:hypothetical protein
VVETTMDVHAWLRKQLEQASPDLLRAMVKEMAEALMGAAALLDEAAPGPLAFARFRWTTGGSSGRTTRSSGSTTRAAQQGDPPPHRRGRDLRP